jgi:uncharacterized protein (DUF1800 family)
MKRREFMERFNLGYRPHQRAFQVDAPPNVILSLDEHTTPLTRAEVTHLLRRFCFAPTADMINQYTGKTAAELVEVLLGPESDPISEATEADWNSKPEENPLTVGNQTIKDQIESDLEKRYGDFCDWWIGLMQEDEAPSREKLVLFWSTVWCIEFPYDTLALIPPPLLYRNNQVLRRDRLANYKKLAEDVTLSGAMLLYQSLQYSTIENDQIPNENYMRELMELFTMGIGNYTEGDIRQGSLALTGWRTHAYLQQPNALKEPFETYFWPAAHSIEQKTFMNQIISSRDPANNNEFQVLEDELRNGILKIMFDEKGPEIAKFICDKIYKYFVYSNNSIDVTAAVDDLAGVMVDSDYELRPVFEKLFTSQMFFSEGIMGCQIKPPPEFIVGFQRQLGVTNYDDSREAIFSLEQALYDPPDVGSWEAYRTWISTATFPSRVKYAKDILAQATSEMLIELGKKMPNYQDADDFVMHLTDYFLPIPLDEDRFGKYKLEMLIEAGTNEAGWSNVIENEDKSAADAIRLVINKVILAPDFQLS